MRYPAPAPVYLGPPFRQSSGTNKPIRRIVLHGTVSPTVAGGARATAAYFRSKAATGSAHYVVDPGEVVQAAWDGVVCWHAPPNPGSLGVELCDPVAGPDGKAAPLARWDDDAHVAMLKRAAQLVAELCLAYNVRPYFVGPIRLRLGWGGLCEHSDVSQAWGQSTHWDLGEFPRRRFAKLVRAEIAYIKAGTKRAPQTATAPSLLLDRMQQLARRPLTRRTSATGAIHHHSKE